MNYNNMMKNWKNFLNESSSPSLLQESLLNEMSPELADRIKEFGERPMEEYTFGNLFGDKRRKVIFMEVRPDGTIFDIIEFFQENGWTVNFGEGIVTKVLETAHGEKPVTLPIMKAMLKVKSAIEAKMVKPKAFYDKNWQSWSPYIVHNTARLEADAPKKARNLHAEYEKIQVNGDKTYDRLLYGQSLMFWIAEIKDDKFGGKAVFKGRDFKGKEMEVTVENSSPVWKADDKLREIFGPSLYRVHSVNGINPYTGKQSQGLRVAVQQGGEFPHLARFYLHQSPYGDVSGAPGGNKIDTWIKYLNTPVPGVKKSGPALDYFQRNPGVLEAMDTKPVIISRDPIDVARQSDFPETGIESCHSEGGMYDYCAIREADRAGLMAFMFEPEDMNEFLFPEDPDTPLSARGLDEIQEALDDWDAEEVMGDPKRDVDGMIPHARARLKRYVNQKEDYELALPDPTVYGSRFPGFTKAVTDWALEEQEGLLPENYAEMDAEEAREFFDSFVYTGGSYHNDAHSGEMFNNLLGVDHYANNLQTPYESEGREEQDPEYTSPNGAEEMEEAAQAVEDRADLEHGGIWYEVQDEMNEVYLYFSGDFRWTFPDEGKETETRSDLELPGWGDQMRELTGEVEAVLYEEDFYYNDVQIEEAGGNIYITVALENEEQANPDGFETFVNWMEELDGDNWERARKKLRSLLRKEGYLNTGEALDDTALEGLKNLKNFVEYDGGEGKHKDFSFELKHIMPIGRGYNMPGILARTYWAAKQRGPMQKLGLPYDVSNLDYHRAYRDLQNGYTPAAPGGTENFLRWYAMGKDLFQFVVRHVLETPPGEQLELPLQEEEEPITARTAQARAAEEETFAGATVQGLEKYLENFTVNVRASRSIPATAHGSVTTPEPTEWEEFGQRGQETGNLARGIQTTVPIEMDIEFDIDEEDTPQEVGLGIQILLWMDKHLDEIQGHAETLLQRYNDVYMKSVDARLKHQEGAADEIETVAAQLSMAAEKMVEEMKDTPVWGDDDAKDYIIKGADDYLMMKKRLMEELMDWSEDEPLEGSLVNRLKAAKKLLNHWKSTEQVRDRIVNVLKTLRLSSDKFYQKIVDVYRAEPLSTRYSVEEAKETVLTRIAYLYSLYTRLGMDAGPRHPEYRNWLNVATQMDFNADPYPEETEETTTPEEISEAVRRILMRSRR